MSGFSTYDSIISRLSVDGAGQDVVIYKTGGTMVASIPYSFWALAGIPAAGTYGTLGKANGRTLTDASTGAPGFTNAGSGKTLHLLTSEGTLQTGSAGSLILVGRIEDGAHCAALLPGELGCPYCFAVERICSSDQKSDRILVTWPSSAMT